MAKRYYTKNEVLKEVKKIFKLSNEQMEKITFEKEYKAGGYDWGYYVSDTIIHISIGTELIASVLYDGDTELTPEFLTKEITNSFEEFEKEIKEMQENIYKIKKRAVEMEKAINFDAFKNKLYFNESK